MEYNTIKIKRPLYNFFKKKKKHPRESFHDVVERSIKKRGKK
jgi:predicted CopG family antitoxin|tara:strand:+ start:33634 stop:33759 length:126 start_codon:yes stop_codon:yes gene_type:complete